MWWIITWKNGLKERIWISTEKLEKLIWANYVIDCEYDDKYKEEINDSMAEFGMAPSC